MNIHVMASTAYDTTDVAHNSVTTVALFEEEFRDKRDLRSKHRQVPSNDWEIKRSQKWVFFMDIQKKMIAL